MPARDRRTADVAVVERAFALFEAGDIEAMLELVAGEAELDPVFEPRVYRGIEAVSSFFLGSGHPPRRWEVRDRELSAAGEWVLVSARLLAEASVGPPLELQVVWLLATANGRITEMRGFPSRRQAIAAARTRAPR